MLSRRAINQTLFVIALLVKKSSVDVDSQQLVKNSLFFPIKTRHIDAVGLTTVQVTILLQKLWIAMHGYKHLTLK